MKLLSLTAIVLALPLSSFAARSVCYVADSTVPTRIERILCLESVSAQGNTLSVVSADGSFPFPVKVTSVVQNENKSVFTAAGYIHDEWNSGCGAGVSAVAVIKGTQENGLISADALDINVEITTTNDTCHNPGSSEVVHYSVVK